MLTDVTLEYENKIVIIDAKYYGRNLSKHYGKDTFFLVFSSIVDEFIVY